MSTRDKIVEKIARAAADKMTVTGWENQDQGAREEWLADTRATLDALTVDDLLRLAGLVGPGAPWLDVEHMAERLNVAGHVDDLCDAAACILDQKERSKNGRRTRHEHPRRDH